MAPGSEIGALADDLKAPHDFEEDLRQGLGQESY
jgi:TusA-related sulfurtransferase